MRILNDELLKNSIENAVLSDIQEGKVGAAAISVLQDGQVRYQRCFGDERIGMHVSEDTLFRLASMTKPVTAVAVLILAEAGLLKLDTEVSHFLPGFAQMDIGRICKDGLEKTSKANRSITVRQLLSHTSGLGSGPVGDFLSRNFPVRERKTLEQVTSYYQQGALDFEPLTSQAYSATFAFDVAARIVEIVSGLPYDEFLDKQIFAPLGMKDTTFSPTKEQWSRMIPMHTYEEGVGKIVDFPENSIFEGIPTTCCCAGAGLASTLKDYQRFAEMLLNYGSLQGHQIVGEKWIHEMATPQVPAAIMAGPEVWGLGVRVITDEAYADLVPGTFGWSGAYGTHFWVDPVNKITAVYLKNSRYDGGAGNRTGRQLEKDVRRAFS